MSRAIIWTFLWTIMCFSSSGAERPQSSETLQIFYDELARDGTWILDEQYGYVWLPAEEGGFRPYYTNGYWALTEYGNTWISYYRWGWAAFHYGRWTYDRYYGWLWIPGNEWSPAWVSWRHNSEFYGWAPLMPREEPDVWLKNSCPLNWWVFVRKFNIYDAHTTIRYNAADNADLFAKTVPLTNIYENQFTALRYFTGPSTDEVCKITANFVCEETGQNISAHQLKDLETPGVTTIRSCVIYMYRPRIIAPGQSGKVLQPASFIKAPKALSKPAPFEYQKGHSPFRDSVDSGTGKTRTTQPTEIKR